jgi:hypothetical protein
VPRARAACADAHVGARVAVPSRAGLAPRLAAGGDAPAAVLLLRGGVPQQRGAPAGAAAQGLPHPADALPAAALRQALPLPPVRQGAGRAGRLAHAREELRPPLAMRMRLRLQAQALAQGPRPGVRRRPRRGAKRRRQDVILWLTSSIYIYGQCYLFFLLDKET